LLRNEIESDYFAELAEVVKENEEQIQNFFEYRYEK
jgi:hypothetical protein